MNKGVQKRANDLTTAHWMMGEGKRRVVAQNFETRVHLKLLAQGMTVYRCPMCMGTKALKVLNMGIDRPADIPPPKVAYLATRGTGNNVSTAWEKLIQW